MFELILNSPLFGGVAQMCLKTFGIAEDSRLSFYYQK